MTSTTEKFPDIIILSDSDRSDDENSPPVVSLTPKRSPLDPAKAATLSADLVAHLARTCPKLRTVKVASVPRNSVVQPIAHSSSSRIQLFKTEADMPVIDGSTTDRIKKPDVILDITREPKIAVERLAIVPSVRKDHPVKPKENALVEKLFAVCRLHSKDETDMDILNKMSSKLQKLEKEYIKMPSFSDFVDDVHRKVEMNPKNMHVQLQIFYSKVHRFCKECKARVAVAPTTSACSAGSSRDATASPLRDAVPKLPTREHSSTTSVSSVPASSNQDLTDSIDQKHKERVKKLETLLKMLDDRIKALEAKELDLDELENDDSTYVKVDLYKKRFMDVWKKLCKLHKEKPNTGRNIEKKFKFEGTIYPEINSKIQKLVKTKFPDYCNVMRIVKNVNIDKGLHLSPISVKKLANQIFENVGKVLKRRRDLDYQEDFGCLLAEEDQRALESDPADEDPLLAQKLEESRRLGEAKQKQVFQYFVDKQMELEAGNGNDGNSDCNMAMDLDASTHLSPPKVEIDCDPEEMNVIAAEADVVVNGESQSWNLQESAETSKPEFSSFIDPPLLGSCDPVLQVKISSPRSISLSQHERESPRPISVCRPICRESPPDVIEDAEALPVAVEKRDRNQYEAVASHFKYAHLPRYKRPLEPVAEQAPIKRTSAFLNKFGDYQASSRFMKMATSNAGAPVYEIEDDDIIVLD